MHARSWSVGVVVALPALLMSPRPTSGQNAAPSRLPRYHVDVVTTLGGYGYDINGRGQVALPSASSTVPYSIVARRWDPRDGFVTLAPDRSFATGINKQGDVTVVQEDDDYRARSALWTERDGMTDLGTIGRQTWART